MSDTLSPRARAAWMRCKAVSRAAAACFRVKPVSSAIAAVNSVLVVPSTSQPWNFRFLGILSCAWARNSSHQGVETGRRPAGGVLPRRRCRCAAGGTRPGFPGTAVRRLAGALRGPRPPHRAAGVERCVLQRMGPPRVPARGVAIQGPGCGPMIPGAGGDTGHVRVRVFHGGTPAELEGVGNAFLADPHPCLRPRAALADRGRDGPAGRGALAGVRGARGGRGPLRYSSWARMHVRDAGRGGTRGGTMTRMWRSLA